jgi:arginase
VPSADQGNLAGPPNPWAAPSGGLRHLDEVAAWNRSVFEAVSRALAAGHTPLLMGGDHCLAIGSISAVAAWCRQERKQLRVIWLDAHTDVNTAAISPSGNLHGMPVACLLGHGPEALVGWSGQRAAIAPEDSTSSASAASTPTRSRPSGCWACQVFDMRHIDEHGMRYTMTEALHDGRRAARDQDQRRPALVRTLARHQPWRLRMLMLPSASRNAQRMSSIWQSAARNAISTSGSGTRSRIRTSL